MTTTNFEEKEKEAEVLNEPVEEAAPEPEIFSLPPEEIDRILEEVRPRPKGHPDPCLFEYTSEDFDKEPGSEYQDSMEAAGYPYW